MRGPRRRPRRGPRRRVLRFEMSDCGWMDRVAEWWNVWVGGWCV